MNQLPVIALLVATYGAILSTILAAREYKKDRRNVQVFLEYLDLYHRAHVVVFNDGHRPVTITDMSIALPINDDWEFVPNNAKYGEDIGEKLPATLSDGELISLVLGSVVSDSLLKADFRAEITVYDAEGKEYTDFKMRNRSAKWGGYYE